MANSEHDHTKWIPIERWKNWCDDFSTRHFRHQVTIDLVASKDGQEGGGRLAFKSPLVAVDYDPESKGYDFVISYGNEADPSRHMISEPVALWQKEDGNGTVLGFHIEDKVGGMTEVTLA